MMFYNQRRWIVHSDSIMRLEFDGSRYYVIPNTDLPIVIDAPKKETETK